MSAAGWIRPHDPVAISRKERSADTASIRPGLRVTGPEDGDKRRAASLPMPWDESEFERAPRAVLRRVLREVLRDPNQRGPMTQNLFPMLVEGPPARRRLVYETLKEFAEPQEILIGSLQLYLRDGNVEPLVVGSGLLEDLGSRSWPVLEAYARSAQPACAYFVPAIARLKGVTAEKRCAVLEILARSEDSELRLRAHWALDGSPPDDMIRISVPGKAAYPLRRPIGLRIFPLPSGGFFIEPVRSELRDILSGKGTTVEEARNDFGCRFDRLIQENRAIPRHDRTPENERIAGILGDLVDWDRYEQENPLIQPIWGQVRERRADGSLRIFWVIGPNGASDREAILGSRDVHPSLAAIPVGRWFYGTARCYPDHVTWVGPPEDAPDPDDPAARLEVWESLPVEYADEPGCWPVREQ